MIHVGMAHGTHSARVGQDAAEQIVRHLSGKARFSWALVFCGGRLKPAEVLDGIRATLGDIDIYGGATTGIITRDYLGYSGYQCGIMAFQEPMPKPLVAKSQSMAADELIAGQELAKVVRAKAHASDTVLLFYDNLKSSNPSQLYLTSRLLQGFHAELQRNDLHIIGAGLLGDFTFYPSFIFNGSQVVKHAAVALILPGQLMKAHTTIMHGCIPVSSFYEITKIDGPVLHELSGRPALEVIANDLAIDIRKLIRMTRTISLTIGKKYGDPYAPFDENMYINRLVVDSDPENGSLTLFEDDFKVGDRVQIMSQDNTNMLNSVQRGTKDLLNSIETMGLNVKFAFYINCTGRAGSISGSPQEEASLVAAHFDSHVPFLGFYSGVEITTLLGRCRALDWTGLLTVFTDASIS